VTSRFSTGQAHCPQTLAGGGLSPVEQGDRVESQVI